jgi:hypothetical protein
MLQLMPIPVAYLGPENVKEKPWATHIIPECGLQVLFIYGVG